jgi:hypothetical protein
LNEKTMTPRGKRRRPARQPFKHSERERAVLRRKQASTIDHLRAGHRYDLVRRAWVDPRGEVVGQ